MSSVGQTLSIRRDTGGHGDVFAALGLADLLACASSRADVRIEENQHAFRVSSAGATLEAVVQSVPHSPGYLYLRAKPGDPTPPGIPESEVLDYAAERERAQRYSEQRRALRGAAKADAEVQELLAQDAPSPDWDLWRTLSSLQGDDTTNRVYVEIRRMDEQAFRTAVQRGLEAIVGGRHSGVAWKSSPVQLFTPTWAKGYSRMKPDSTDRNKDTRDQWMDPFLEWLKYRGYFLAACPYATGPKRENVRLLCPVPADMSARAFVDLVQELRRARLFGAEPQLDALGVLKVAELLVRGSEYYQGQDRLPLGITLGDRTPSQVISGVYITQYQSLGQSKSVSSMTLLAVPGWFPVTSASDAQDWLDILQEHRKVVRGLRGDHSDEISLLVAYRRFLEQRGADALWALVEFMERYGAFLLRAREQKRRVSSFRANNLRRLVMALSNTLTPILDDPGFVAVATAVRKATVSAQHQKAMGRKDYREIRYDLLPELRRKRSVPGPGFVETVAEFVSLYNAENARRREQGLIAPRNVTTEEFHSFVALVGCYGAPTVGALLCAYGSCRDPKEPETPEVDEGEAETEQD